MGAWLWLSGMKTARMLHKGTIRDAMVHKALTSASASRILATCIRRPVSVKQISDNTDIPLASAYRQVKSLLDDGLIVVERSAMTSDGKTYDLYRSRIRRAVLEVGPDGVHVVWEPNADVEDHLVDMWGKLGG
jgi:DNA-binding transcriptional ArsR family regulator